MAITKKDIESLKEVFATKDDLSKLRNDMLTGFDKVMKKMEDTSTEQKMAYAQYRRQEDRLENHETRIKTLETKVLAV